MQVKKLLHTIMRTKDVEPYTEREEVRVRYMSLHLELGRVMCLEGQWLMVGLGR